MIVRVFREPKAEPFIPRRLGFLFVAPLTVVRPFAVFASGSPVGGGAAGSPIVNVVPESALVVVN